MQCPTDVQGVQRVLGVANYLAKFTPKLSTVCEPLRRLLDKDSVFDWLPQHETAFSRMKELIPQAPVLLYYDVNKEVSLECDSSEVGLGAVIKQGGHPIAYVSRALTKTERNYAQIEKECLAIVFVAERFEQYILGKEKVKVFSDHKPLETILSKSIHTSPKRLQRMRLRLQKYSLDVEFKPGPQMYISDTLSRASLPATETAREDKATIFEIHELMEKFELEDHHFVSDHRLARIKEETGQDTTLLALIEITKKRLASWQKRQSTQYQGILAIPWWTSHRKWPSLSRHTPHHTDKTEARDGRQSTQVPLRHPVHPKYCPWDNVLATDACGNHWSCPALWNLPARPTATTTTISDVLPNSDSPVAISGQRLFWNKWQTLCSAGGYLLRLYITNPAPWPQ